MSKEYIDICNNIDRHKQNFINLRIRKTTNSLKNNKPWAKKETRPRQHLSNLFFLTNFNSFSDTNL